MDGRRDVCIGPLVDRQATAVFDIHQLFQRLTRIRGNVSNLRFAQVDQRALEATTIQNELIASFLLQDDQINFLTSRCSCYYAAKRLATGFGADNGCGGSQCADLERDFHFLEHAAVGKEDGPHLTNAILFRHNREGRTVARFAYSWHLDLGLVIANDLEIVAVQHNSYLDLLDVGVGEQLFGGKRGSGNYTFTRAVDIELEFVGFTNLQRVTWLVVANPGIDHTFVGGWLWWWRRGFGCRRDGYHFGFLATQCHAKVDRRFSCGCSLKWVSTGLCVRAQYLGE